MTDLLKIDGLDAFYGDFQALFEIDLRWPRPKQLPLSGQMAPENPRF